MYISRIDIENFRSIKKSVIPIEQRFVVLLGENESGKTNFLNAIMLLNRDPAKSVDLRIPFVNEDAVLPGRVTFSFMLDDVDFDAIYSLIGMAILDSGEEFCEIEGRRINLRLFIKEHFKEFVFTVDIVTRRREVFLWKTFDSSIENFGVISVVKDSVPRSIRTLGKRLGGFKFLISSDKSGVHEHVITCDIKILYDFIAVVVEEYASRGIPKVTMWNYSDNIKFPSVVNASSFFSDPDTEPALKSLFVIAGYADNLQISSVYSDNVDFRARYRSLLQHVGVRATEGLRKIWPDSAVAFNLFPDGDDIHCVIKDVFNDFDFSVRSDGFKRAVNFLLSAAAKQGKGAASSIFILDEPDVGLHPSAVRMLRSELVRLSKDFQIFASTHSTHMIDRYEMNRHLIVKKYDEVTEIVTPGESGFYQEEVLYAALTDSVFSVLKANNFIFEGWYDKRMFDLAMSRKIDVKGGFRQYDDVGVCYAGGCTKFRCIAPIFCAAKRRYLIVSDSDSPAKKSQKEYAEERFCGKWFRYDELMGNDNFVTSEDFLSTEFFCKNFVEFCAHEGIDSEKVKLDEVAGGNRLEIARRGLLKAGIRQCDVDSMLDKLKAWLFDRVMPDDIDDAYYEMLKRAYSHFLI